MNPAMQYAALFNWAIFLWATAGLVLGFFALVMQLSVFTKEKLKDAPHTSLAFSTSLLFWCWIFDILFMVYFVRQLINTETIDPNTVILLLIISGMVLTPYFAGYLILINKK